MFWKKKIVENKWAKTKPMTEPTEPTEKETDSRNWKYCNECSIEFTTGEADSWFVPWPSEDKGNYLDEWEELTMWFLNSLEPRYFQFVHDEGVTILDRSQIVRIKIRITHRNS